MKLTTQNNGRITVKGSMGNQTVKLVNQTVPESWWNQPAQQEWSRLAGIKEQPPQHFEMGN